MSDSKPKKQSAINLDRRRFITRSAGLGAASALGLNSLPHAFAAGSDQPELKEIPIGFIPLTDCAPLVIAAAKGFDKKYGISLKLSKEASWAGVRDKLVNGELFASHALYGMIYGLQLGIGGAPRDMAVLMNLNFNGQAITLSNHLQSKGVTDGPSLSKLIKSQKESLTFAQTFPTGTHALWLNYWLAEQGIHPLKDVKIIVVPPPQMVANMRVGNMDGFCVGEPWNARAIEDKIGFTATTTQDIWPDHPEKVLATTRDRVTRYPNTMRALIAAVLDASRYCDEPANRIEVASIISEKSFVNAPKEVITPRFTGQYQNGLGRSWKEVHNMTFFKDGMASFPYPSDGMWFMTQFKRWGMIKDHPDYEKLAMQVNQIGLYKEAAALTKTPLPTSPLRTSRFGDGRVWDASQPKHYADSFTIQASS